MAAVESDVLSVYECLDFLAYQTLSCSVYRYSFYEDKERRDVVAVLHGIVVVVEC